jgi:hypothetical protein
MPLPGRYLAGQLGGGLPGGASQFGAPFSQNSGGDVACPAGSFTNIFGSMSLQLTDDLFYVVSAAGCLVVANGAAAPTQIQIQFQIPAGWGGTNVTVTLPAFFLAASTTFAIPVDLTASTQPPTGDPGAAGAFAIKLKPTTNAVTVKQNSWVGLSAVAWES